MMGIGVREASITVLRPVVRAADGVVHNRERRRLIRRYRRVACVTLVPLRDDQRFGDPVGS